MYHSVLCRVEHVVDGLRVNRMSVLGSERIAAAHAALIAEVVGFMDGYVEQLRAALSTVWFTTESFKYSFGAFRVSINSLRDSLEGTKILSDVNTELQAITSLIEEVNDLAIIDSDLANSLLDRMVILVNNLRPPSTP
jgi:hypothetical protein